MAGPLGGALGDGFIGALTGALLACLFLVVMKLLGKPIGKQTISLRARPQSIPVPMTWKTESKRLLFGVVWFFVIWFVIRELIGAILGGIAGSEVAPQKAFGPGDREALFYVAQAAVVRFFDQYGLLVAFGSFIMALLGTLTGFLPGTKRPTVSLESSANISEGNWPPPPTDTAS